MTTSEQETTKKRLLAAALNVFAVSGFKGASIREICASAGANIAAVNYHFGSKEELYRATVKHHIGELQLPEGTLDPGYPRKSLEDYYFFQLMSAAKPGSPLHSLVCIRHSEELSPSGLLNDFWKEHFMRNYLEMQVFISTWSDGCFPQKAQDSLVLALLGLPTIRILCRPWLELLLTNEPYSLSELKDYSQSLARQAIGLMTSALEETTCD